MDLDLDAWRIRLSVGELADFTLGPRDGGEGPAGLWRAQLGTRWHRELQAQAVEADPAVAFEVSIEGRLTAGRWAVHLGGRIDQLARGANGPILREIKTVTRPLPDGEEVLRREYPGYFVQLAVYRALLTERPAVAELVFVEIATGLTQTVLLTPADDSLLTAQLARLQEFCELRWRARERLRTLTFSPAFAELRPGQEDVGAELAREASRGRRAVLLEAPTGFGKTGVLLEFALGRLRAGDFERVIYLTGKATGQLQVTRTLEAMAPPAGRGGPAAWVVRPKPEHCVNPVYHCVRDACRFLDGLESRWNGSGLARFYLLDGQPRDLASLRAAGLDARICPYEITRAALPFNDLWVGDYNYVFAPGSRGFFSHQPGFEPGRTLLLVDEAHNLPARVADACSHLLSGADAHAAAVLLAATHPMSELARTWNDWSAFLLGLSPCAALSPAAEADAFALLTQLGTLVRESGVDYGALTPRATEVIWQTAGLIEALSEPDFPRLWWCRRAGELSLTCLDASAHIGETLGQFGGVVLATATPGPLRDFAAACGLGEPEWKPSPPPPDAGSAAHLGGRLGALTRRETRQLARIVGTASDLLRRETAAEEPIAHVLAHAPWRRGAYDVALDLRADTTFLHRAAHSRLTALTVEAMAESAGGAPTVAFFPSYAYAEMIAAELQALQVPLQVQLQAKGVDLAGQAAWMEQALDEADLLLLVLGSGFSEGIDLLGGRVSRALVAGPALPEVNAVQRARLAAMAPLGRETAVRRTYQIPGMQKVNQALGRLVRAPGQTARVILHCRRFAEATYNQLLAPDYRDGVRIESDEAFKQWLTRASQSP